MKTASHNTGAIYRRYAIADESVFWENAAKLEALLQAQRDLTRMAVPQRTGRVTRHSRPVATESSSR